MAMQSLLDGVFPSVISKLVCAYTAGPLIAVFYKERVDLVDLSSNIRYSLPDLDAAFKCTETSALYHEQKVYLFGGWHPKGETSNGELDFAKDRTCCVFSMDSGRWKWASFPPMLAGRSDHTSHYYNNKFYIIGGCQNLDYDVDLVLRCGEMFDMKTQKWSPLSEEKSHGVHWMHGSCLVGNRIYVIGNPKTNSGEWGSSLMRVFFNEAND